MKVVCDNCRAVYRVPDEKLVKAVNKATCRNCGHRMLIPRPKPNADPEERTLVTAVPPTPVGAPPRAAAMDEEGPEPTLPGRPPQAPMQRRPPRPSHERTPPVDDTQIPAPDAFDDQPETVVRGVPPDAQPTERPEPAPLQRRTPGPAGRRAPPPRRATPAPAAQRRGTPPPVGQRSTPAPMSPRGTPLPAPNAGAWAHDPAADLNWALLGTACALFGAFLLALLSVFNHPLVMWFGLAMAFGGGVLSFMVLLTSGRGRRPARTMLSVVLGFGVAVIMASSMVGTKWGAERVIDAWDINFSKTNMASVSPSNGGIDPTPQPTLASVAPVDDGTEVVGEGTEGEGTEGEGDGTEGSEGEGSSETSTTPSPKPSEPRPTRPSPSPSPSSSPSPSPAPAAPAPAAPAPAPAATSGGGMETVPTEVVHVMLSNNIDIKRCFVPLFKAGALPPRVDVKFQIAPSGSAASVGVVQSQYKGTELERCLASAVGGIQFPPTNGPGTSITYPFVLQQ